MRMTHELQMLATGTISILETLNLQTLFPIPKQFLITIKKMLKILLPPNTVLLKGRWAITFPLYLVEPNFILGKRMSGKT